MSETIVNIFELASRKKLRFDTPVHTGLNIEQLWDLPLQTTRANTSDLDSAGKVLLRELREQTEESLIEPDYNSLKQVTQLKLEIIKHIIAAKQAENAAKVQAVQRETERATLRQLLTEKHADELKGLSKAEIEERLRALGG